MHGEQPQGFRNRRNRPLLSDSFAPSPGATQQASSLLNFGSSWTSRAPATTSLPPPTAVASTSSSSLKGLNDVPEVPFTTGDMPCRERTAEFTTAAKSIAMRQAGAVTPLSRKGRAVAEAMQFNQMAKRIGRDLSETCAKLEKLALLGKRTSLFNDRVGEMEELTQGVKTDISSLNKQIGTLQEFVVSRGEGNGKTRSASGQHSRSVVVGLQSKLVTVSQEFKSVLEARTETLKVQKSRREKFSQSSGVPSTLPSSMSSGRLGSVLMAAEQDDRASSSAVSLDMDALEARRSQQQMQVSLIDEQESYVASRATAMEDIQGSIVELGSIFRQLASLVQEQGETVQRIDSHVEETALNIDAAHGELLKYFQNISKNRWLFIKVFGVLIVFFIIFVVFLT